MQEIVSEVSLQPQQAFELEGTWIYKLVRSAAIAGGFVFLALVIMLIVTIIGRKLFNWQVPGDVELVQMGAAFASAPFFAWCHLMRGDVKVDFLTQNLPPRWTNFLDGIGSLLIGLFGALLAWRTSAQALGSAKNGEISAILAWPVWIPQALMVPGFVLLALTGFYLAFQLFSVDKEAIAAGSKISAQELVS
jgi:TRAP-type C4-dicarboxylate transport system permease small subunit